MTNYDTIKQKAQNDLILSYGRKATFWSRIKSIETTVWHSDPHFISRQDNIFLVPILLEDLSSVERPLSDSLKFLSSLDQELKWSKKRSAESGPIKKVKEENIVNVELKKICNMSIDQV